MDIITLMTSTYLHVDVLTTMVTSTKLPVDVMTIIMITTQLPLDVLITSDQYQLPVHVINVITSTHLPVDVITTIAAAMQFTAASTAANAVVCVISVGRGVS